MRLQVALLFLVYTEGKKEPRDFDDAVAPNIDIFPAPFPSPVPFGHIFKDGIGDVSPGQKQPIDPLEIDLITPNRAEQDKYIKSAPKTNLLKIVEHPILTNPRDEYHRFNLLNDEDLIKENVTATTNRTDDRPPWFHFEAILEHNIKTPRPALALEVQKLATPIAEELRPDVKRENVSKTDMNLEVPGKTHYFSANTFSLYKDPDTRQIYDYWTTCDQFEKKSRNFLPKDIVDIDWVPFYVWTTRNFVVSIVHRFSFPSRKTVKEYKQSYGPYLNVTVDWERPKLLLREEIEMLLIAADRNGLFYGIPRVKMPFGRKYSKDVRLPVISLRLKIEDPYLALTYCDEYYALIMAAPGAEPRTDEEKTEEAAILNFKGVGFPISRDLEFEERARRVKIEKEKESEETRYIKAVGTGVDIERE